MVIVPLKVSPLRAETLCIKAGLAVTRQEEGEATPAPTQAPQAPEEHLSVAEEGEAPAHRLVVVAELEELEQMEL